MTISLDAENDMGTNYTIDNFWKERLSKATSSPIDKIAGWSFETTSLETFQEAPLVRNDILSAEDDPQTSSIILVSAPGAVGKSTLARQIAYTAGAVYIDLAKTEPVGGNTISGGLVKTGLYEAWKNGQIALLIDGLDEARLRVTQEAFSAFLLDIADIAQKSTMPLVVFGRTGAVQDAWIVLEDTGVSLAILEIGYYGPDEAVEFAIARVRAATPHSAHETVQREAVSLLLSKLREQTQSDGDRFSGYAPVLQAVASRVEREDNPAALIAKVKSGEQPVTLHTVVSSILERERGKLGQLKLEDPTLAQKLYQADEQLDRLVARRYNVTAPSFPPMAPSDAQAYSNALATWVEDHPFLDGDKGTSSAVFEAAIIVNALKNSASAEMAVARELKRGAAANPFVAEFYLPDKPDDKRHYLPPGHIGVVYASLRARLSLGDEATLLVDSSEDAANDEDALQAQVEITLSRPNIEQQRVLNFDTEQTGTLRLGTYVEDVEISAPLSHVEIGPGPEALLVSPVSIQCEKLTLSSDKVIAECPPNLAEGSVFLEATEIDAPRISSVPTLRGNVKLSVVWPNSQAHPWTSFSALPTPIADPRLDEALRRFRKFVIAFRSHSKGSLKRYRPKIEHARMTKESGQAVLDLLVDNKILSVTGNMYTLDPDKLGELAGATYAEAMAKKFSAKTQQFVLTALR